MITKIKIQLISIMLIVFSSFCVAQSGTWTELKPKNSPPGRVDFGMSSIGDGKAIIFGGQGSTPGYLGDTWIYDYDSNNWTEIKCDVSPSPRARINLAYLNDKKVLLYGGEAYSGEWLSDTWIFDIDSLNWFEIKPKNKVWYQGQFSREDYALAHLSKNRVLLYSGLTDTMWPDDSWVFDLDSLNWLERIPSSVDPGNLQHSQMCFLEEGKTLLFGGFSHSKNIINETWIFDESIKTEYYWKKLYPVEKPEPSSEHALSELNENYLLLLDIYTWIFNISNQQWIKIDTTIYNFEKSWPKMSKIKQNKVIIFGGKSIGKPNDTWLFSLDPTDVEETQTTNILISPNPASDYIEIRQPSEGLKPSEGSKIEIFNIFGESISTTPPFGHPFELEGEKINIDISNLPAGVYFIKIGDKFEKFIKM